ncbi:MAG: hypothetical protein ACLQVD_12905 [Capsulimonadaceae bacterium]
MATRNESTGRYEKAVAASRRGERRETRPVRKPESPCRTAPERTERRGAGEFKEPAAARASRESYATLMGLTAGEERKEHRRAGRPAARERGADEGTGRRGRRA